MLRYSLTRIRPRFRRRPKRNAKSRGTRPHVPFNLFFSRFYCTGGRRKARRMRRDVSRPVARARRLTARALAQKSLHQPVLEAVKRYDGKPPARPEHPLRRLEAFHQLVEFAVEVDANGLKHTGRGI